MLGLNHNGNSWKYAVANFLTIFVMAMIAQLALKLPSGIFPSNFEIYECLINALGTAFASTGAIYGINKVTKENS